MLTRLFRCDYASLEEVVSVRPSVPSYFLTPNMAVFEGEKLPTDIVNDGTMSDDEAVASDVPTRYLFRYSRTYFD